MATSTKAPVRKVTVGGVAGAIVTVIIGVLGQINPDLAEWPEGFEAALTTIVTFLASYFTPPGTNEAVITDPSGASKSGTTT